MSLFQFNKSLLLENHLNTGLTVCGCSLLCIAFYCLVCDYAIDLNNSLIKI